VKPSKIRVSNFRSYDSTEWLNFEEKVTIVGENNAGKSNLLQAFHEFFSFGSHTGHDRSDFHNRQVENPIAIDICFTELEDEVLEAFKSNVFGDELVIRAELPYDSDLNTADTKQYYGRKEVLKHDELRDISSMDPDEAVAVYYEHEELLEPFKTDETWKSESRASVERVVAAYRDSGEAVVEKDWETLSKSDLKEHLPDFSYFPATRSLDDATRTTNKSSLLSQLLRSAVDEIPTEETEEVESSLHEIQSRLNGSDKFEPIRELEKDLSRKLSMQIRDLDNISIQTEVPDLEELLIRNIEVRVDDINGSLIDDLGSGSQMSFLLACLWELSERDTDTIVFALEEPENDLHPHAQRQLYKTLNRLTERGHTVLLTTHSPDLVTLNDINNVVRVEKREGASKLCTTGDRRFDETERRKLRTLMTTDKNEIFFCRGMLLCEGPSERQTIPVLNETLSRYNEDIDLFDAKGVSLVDAGGKENMSLFATVAEIFDIPLVAVLDDDREEDPENERNNEDHEAIAEELEGLATVFVHLEEDLEFALFKSLSVEEFCDSMSVVCSFDKSADDIRRAIEGSGRSKEEEFKSWFGRYRPSKPQFGRAAVDRIEEDRVPEQIADVIKRSLEIAE